MIYMKVKRKTGDGSMFMKELYNLYRSNLKNGVMNRAPFHLSYSAREVAPKLKEEICITGVYGKYIYGFVEYSVSMPKRILDSWTYLPKEEQNKAMEKTYLRYFFKLPSKYLGLTKTEYGYLITDPFDVVSESVLISFEDYQKVATDEYYPVKEQSRDIMLDTMWRTPYERLQKTFDLTPLNIGPNNIKVLSMKRNGTYVVIEFHYDDVFYYFITVTVYSLNRDKPLLNHIENAIRGR